jgi:hypothetical protein
MALVSVTFLPLPAPRRPKRLDYGDRLDQAISICQEWRIPILHAHLKLEPLGLKPGGAKGVLHPARKVQDMAHHA